MDVMILKCQRYNLSKIEQSINEILDQLHIKFSSGQKILLKPNLFGNFSPARAVTTHPLFIEAICKILKKQHCEIFLGESPGQNEENIFLPLLYLKKKYGVKFIEFNKTKLTKYKNPNNHFLKEINLPSYINEVDIIINLPKLKTHSLTIMTGAVKNLFGFIPGRKKLLIHKIAPKEKDFCEALLENLNFIKPHITIMDAIVGMEGNGPTNGEPKNTGLILASKDPVALDLVASRIMGFNEMSILTNKLAIEKGIFNAKLNIIGNKSIRIPYKKPTSRFLKFLPFFFTSWINHKKIIIDKKKCKKCLKCFSACPTKAIIKENILNDRTNDIVNYNKCIQCFCCQEHCPYKAILLKPRIIFNLISKSLSRGKRI